MTRLPGFPPLQTPVFAFLFTSSLKFFIEKRAIVVPQLFLRNNYCPLCLAWSSPCLGFSDTLDTSENSDIFLFPGKELILL